MLANFHDNFLQQMSTLATMYTLEKDYDGVKFYLSTFQLEWLTKYFQSERFNSTVAGRHLEKEFTDSDKIKWTDSFPWVSRNLLCSRLKIGHFGWSSVQIISQLKYLITNLLINCYNWTNTWTFKNLFKLGHKIKYHDRSHCWKRLHFAKIWTQGLANSS